MTIFCKFLTCIVLAAALAVPAAAPGEDATNEVFLVERYNKLLAFSGIRNNWFEKELRSGEKLVASRFAGNVAVAYTNERALAFSAITGRWAEEKFRIRESVISISAEGNVATVVTTARALGFSAQTGAWMETQFNIGE